MEKFNFFVNRICANTPPMGNKGTSRFLLMLVLMLTMGVGNVWGANSGLTASPGVFIIDFYNSSKLTSTSGTTLDASGCQSHLTVPTGVTASDVVTGVANTGTVRYDMNGGLTLGTSSTGKSQTTLTIGSNYPIRKIIAVGTEYGSDGAPLYVAGTSVTLNTGQSKYADCSKSTTITPSFITSLVIKQNNGSNKKRATLYTAVCEYGYRAYLTAPGTGSISAVPKTANENGAGWNGTEGAVVGLKSTQKVTLTATPPSGYEVDAWTVKKKSDNSDVTASVLSGTTLTMPAYDVTVSVTWRSTASCGVNPTAGSASLNGSISLSSFPVQTTGWTVGANCAWSDFGFVWSSSVSTPTLESNGTASSGCTKIPKATDGTSTSTSHSITGTFNTSTSYYVRGYGKNGYASGTYQYTDVLTITPRSVEFNSNGGSAVDTKYVNSGTKVTAPSDPTKTGYNFGEWQLNSSEFDFANTNVTSNITLVATWTAKTTTVSFNQTSGTGGQTGTLTATYGSAMPSAPVTCPTRTGYDFGGYYDGSGGSGTQYYTNTGASARNWDKEDATYTLHAKWTVKNYSVTWKVNNTNYTTGGPSDNVNHGSRVAKLPTDPDPNDYCGQKFVGWTDATDGAYVHGTSNLFTTAGTAPIANGAQIFYAVFADYDE